jgi:hypothetical protein
MELRTPSTRRAVDRAGIETHVGLRPEAAIRCAAAIRQQLGLKGPAWRMLETTQLICFVPYCSPNKTATAMVAR